MGMMVAPGSALAVNCSQLMGSGSSLQAEQQTLWTNDIPNPLGECASGPHVLYLSTSSGKGLSEWGSNEKSELLTSEDGCKGCGELDGFVGTDDPPTHTELLEMLKASESETLVTPIVAAPVAIILHAPKECELKGSSNLAVSLLPLTLELAFTQLETWSQFLLLVHSHALALSRALSFKETGACNNHLLLEVRSDSSGTSFATKQFLCQIEPAVWTEEANATVEKCQSGKGLVTDAQKWFLAPTGPLVSFLHGNKVLNEGSKGEAAAVESTEGSIGYVNTANAVAAHFLPFGGESKQSLLLFWAPVNDQEPVKGASGTEANCPTAFTLTATQEAEAKKSEWEKIHLANPGEETDYPLCTFTYDVGWQNYKTTKLNTAYGATLATEIGNSAKKYFEYMTSSALGNHGQKEIANYYSALPTGTFLTIAQEISKEIG
jgi:ABC-type phosphate transport system substrate-binding protein